MDVSLTTPTNGVNIGVIGSDGVVSVGNLPPGTTTLTASVSLAGNQILTIPINLSAIALPGLPNVAGLGSVSGLTGSVLSLSGLCATGSIPVTPALVALPTIALTGVAQTITVLCQDLTTGCVSLSNIINIPAALVPTLTSLLGNPLCVGQLQSFTLVPGGLPLGIDLTSAGITVSVTGGTNVTATVGGAGVVTVSGLSAGINSLTATVSLNGTPLVSVPVNLSAIALPGLPNVAGLGSVSGLTGSVLSLSGLCATGSVPVTPALVALPTIALTGVAQTITVLCQDITTGCVSLSNIINIPAALVPTLTSLLGSPLCVGQLQSFTLVPGGLPLGIDLTSAGITVSVTGGTNVTATVGGAGVVTVSGLSAGINSLTATVSLNGTPLVSVPVNLSAIALPGLPNVAGLGSVSGLTGSVLSLSGLCATGSVPVTPALVALPTIALTGVAQTITVLCQDITTGCVSLSNIINIPAALVPTLTSLLGSPLCVGQLQSFTLVPGGLPLGIDLTSAGITVSVTGGTNVTATVGGAGVVTVSGLSAGINSLTATVSLNGTPLVSVPVNLSAIALPGLPNVAGLGSVSGLTGSVLSLSGLCATGSVPVTPALVALPTIALTGVAQTITVLCQDITTGCVSLSNIINIPAALVPTLTSLLGSPLCVGQLQSFTLVPGGLPLGIDLTSAGITVSVTGGTNVTATVGGAGVVTVSGLSAGINSLTATVSLNGTPLVSVPVNLSAIALPGLPNVAGLGSVSGLTGSVLSLSGLCATGSVPVTPALVALPTIALTGVAQTITVLCQDITTGCVSLSNIINIPAALVPTLTSLLGSPLCVGQLQSFTLVPGGLPLGIDLTSAGITVSVTGGTNVTATVGGAGVVTVSGLSAGINSLTATVSLNGTPLVSVPVNLSAIALPGLPNVAGLGSVSGLTGSVLSLSGLCATGSVPVTPALVALPTIALTGVAQTITVLCQDITTGCVSLSNIINIPAALVPTLTSLLGSPLCVGQLQSFTLVPGGLPLGIDLTSAGITVSVTGGTNVTATVGGAGVVTVSGLNAGVNNLTATVSLNGTPLVSVPVNLSAIALPGLPNVAGLGSVSGLTGSVLSLSGLCATGSVPVTPALVALPTIALTGVAQTITVLCQDITTGCVSLSNIINIPAALVPTLTSLLGSPLCVGQLQSFTLVPGGLPLGIDLTSAGVTVSVTGGTNVTATVGGAGVVTVSGLSAGLNSLTATVSLNGTPLVSVPVNLSAIALPGLPNVAGLGSVSGLTGSVLSLSGLCATGSIPVTPALVALPTIALTGVAQTITVLCQDITTGCVSLSNIINIPAALVPTLTSLLGSPLCVGQLQSFTLVPGGLPLGIDLTSAGITVSVTGGTNVTATVGGAGVVTVSGLSAGINSLTATVSLNGTPLVSVPVNLSAIALPGLPNVAGLGSVSGLTGSVLSLSGLCATGSIPVTPALVALPTIALTGVAQTITVLCQDLTTGCVSLSNIINIPAALVPTLTSLLGNPLCVGQLQSFTLVPGGLPLGIDLTSAGVTVSVTGGTNVTATVGGAGVVTVSGLSAGLNSLTATVSLNGTPLVSVPVNLSAIALPGLPNVAGLGSVSGLTGSVLSLSGLCATGSVPVTPALVALPTIALTGVAQTITVLCQDLTTGCVSLSNIINIPAALVPTLTSLLGSPLCVGQLQSFTLVPGGLPLGIDLTSAGITVSVTGGTNVTATVGGAGVVTVSGLNAGVNNLTATVSLNGTPLVSVPVNLSAIALPGLPNVAGLGSVSGLTGSVLSLSGLCATGSVPVTPALVALPTIALTGVAQTITVLCQDLTTGCVSLSNIINIPAALVPTLTSLLGNPLCVGQLQSFTLVPGGLPLGIDLTSAGVTVSVTGGTNVTATVGGAGVVTVSGLSAGLNSLTATVSLNGTPLVSVPVNLSAIALPGLPNVAGLGSVSGLTGSVLSLSGLCATGSIPVTPALVALPTIALTGVAQTITVLCQDLTTGCVSLSNIINIPAALVPTLTSLLGSPLCVGQLQSFTLVPGGLPLGIDLTSAGITVSVTGGTNVTATVGGAGVVTVSGLSAGINSLTATVSLNGTPLVSVPVNLSAIALPGLPNVAGLGSVSGLTGSVLSLSGLCATGSIPVTPALVALPTIALTGVAQTITVLCQDLTTGCVSLSNIINIPAALVPTLTSLLGSPLCVGQLQSFTLVPGGLPLGIDLTSAGVTVSVTGGTNVTATVGGAGVVTVSGLSAGINSLTATVSLNGTPLVSVPVNLSAIALPSLPNVAGLGSVSGLTGSVLSLSGLCATGSIPVTPALVALPTIALTGVAQTITVLCQDLTTGCVSLSNIINIPAALVPTLTSLLGSPLCVGQLQSFTLVPGGLPLGIDLTSAGITVSVTGGTNVTATVGGAGVVTVSGLSAGINSLTATVSLNGTPLVSVPVNLSAIALPTAPVAPVSSVTGLLGSVLSLTGLCPVVGTLPVLAGNGLAGIANGILPVSTTAVGVQSLTVLCTNGQCLSVPTIIPVTILDPVLTVLPSIVCVGQPLSLTLLPTNLLTPLTSSLVSVSVSGPANLTVGAINSNGVLTVSGLSSGTTTLTVSLSVSGVQVASVQVPVSVLAIPAVATIASPLTGLVGSTVSLSNVCGTGIIPLLTGAGVTGLNVTLTSVAQTLTVVCSNGICQSLTTIGVPAGINITGLSPGTVCLGAGQPISLTLVPTGINLTDAGITVAATGNNGTNIGVTAFTGSVLTLNSTSLATGLNSLTVTVSLNGVPLVSIPLNLTVLNPIVQSVTGGTSQTFAQGIGSTLLAVVCNTLTATPVFSNGTGAINLSVPGTTTLTVSCQDGLCISPPVTITAVVLPPVIPIPVLTPSLVSVCIGNPISVTVTGLGSLSSLVTFSVTGGVASLTQTGDVLTLSGLLAGPQTLTLTASLLGSVPVSVPLNLTVLNPTVPTIAASQTVLQGVGSTLLNAVCATGVPVFSNGTGLVSLSAVGPVSLTVSCQDGLCVSAPVPVTVVVVPQVIPTPVLNPTTLQACLGNPISVTVSGLTSVTTAITYALTGGGVLTQSGNVLTISGLPTGVQTLTLTASAPGYTAISVPVSVTVYNPTAPTIAGGNSLTIGQGSVGALIPASCASGSPVYTPSATIDATTAGVFTYSVTCQDGPCVSPATVVTVTITPLVIPSVPTPVLNPATLQACLGSPVSVTVSGLSSVTTAVTFTLTGGGVLTQSGNVLTISGLPAGVQTLTLTASAAGYISTSVSVSVTVFNPTAPVVAGGTSQTVIQGTTALLSASCATGTVAYSPSASINTTATGVFTYSVTCQDGPCVSAATLVTVTVAPVPTIPTPVLNPTTVQACLGSPVSVTVSGLSSVTTAVTFTLTGGGVLAQTGNVLTINGLPAGVQTLTLTASAAGFTPVSVPVSVTVYNPTAPVVAGGASQTVIQGTTALLSASCATGTVAYSPSASINTTATGVFTYSVTCQDGPCVSAATLVTVTVAPVPTIPTPVLNPATLQACLGSPVSVTVSGLSSVTSTVAFTLTGGGVLTQTGNVLTISGLPAGVQTLTLTASAAGFNPVSVPVSVTVFNPTAPVVAGGNTRTVIQGTTGALISASCATGTVVYSPSATIDATATGVFTYSVTCQAGPCVSAATLVTVTVAPVPTIPTPVLNPTTLQACLGSPVSVTVSGLSSVTTAVTFTLTGGGTLAQSGNVLTISGLPTGVQTLTLTASAAGFTPVSVPVSVTVYNPTTPTIAPGTALTVAVGSPSSLIPVLCATGTPVYRNVAGVIVTSLPTNVAGVVSYTATCQDGPCVSTGLPVKVTVLVPLLPLPAITLNPATLQVCFGSPASLTVTGLGSLSASVSYTVSGSATLAQVANVITLTGLPTGVQTLTLTASAPGYTAISVPLSVTVYNPTAPTIAGGNSLTIGQGSVGALIPASCASGSPVYTPSATIDATTAGVFTYSVTCQDGPCVSPATVVTVTITPLVIPSVPTPVLNPATLQACLGSPVSVTVSGLSSVTTAVTFTLTGGGVLTQSGNVLTISGLPAGVQTLTLTASAAGYISTSVSVSVTVFNPTAPVVAGGTSQTVIQGTTALLSASCATGTVAYNPSASINTTATGVFTYSVTCQAGPCVSAATVVTVTVAPVPTLPTPVLNPTTVQACLGSPVSVTVSGLSSVTTAVTFTLTGGGVLTQSGNVLTISGLPAGVQTLTLTASAAGFTSVSVPVSVTVFNPTAPTIAGGNSLTFGQGTTGAQIVASCATGAPVYSPTRLINTSLAGVSTYVVSCTAGPCTSAPVTVTVTVAPLPTIPTPTLTPTALQACLGSPVSVTVSGLSSVTTAVTFTLAGGGVLTQSGNVLTINGLPAGVQTLTLTASAAGFTPVSVPVSVTVFNPTAPVVAGGTSQTVTQGTTALLSASCATGTVAYSPSASINTTATGVFTYSVTCQDGPCVSAATLVTVTVAPVPTIPTPVLNPATVQACLGSPVSVTVSGLSSVTTAVTFTLTGGGVLTQSGNVLTINGLPAGVQTLTLTASAAGFTSVSVPVSVTVFNPTAPVIAGGTSQTIVQGTIGALLSASCATGVPVYTPSASIVTSATGVFTYSVVCQDGICLSTPTTATITVVPVPPTPVIPTPVLNPTTVQACLGSPVSVTVSGLSSVTTAVTYSLTGGGLLTQSGNVLTISNLPSGVQTLTLTASAPGYTATSVPVSVTVFNPTAPTIAGGNSLTIGQGSTGATLFATCATGTPVYSPSATINATTAGVFTYTVTCQAGACVSPPTTVTVTVMSSLPPTIPTPILSPTALQACTGSPVSVTVSGLSSVTTAITYTLTGGGTLTQSGNVLTISGLPTGVQTLTLTVSAPGYTSTSVLVSVTIGNAAPPVITGGTSQTVDQGTVTALMATCAMGTPVFSPSNLINAETGGVLNYTVICQQGSCVSTPVLVAITVRPGVVSGQCGSNLDGTPLRATAPVFDCGLITTTGEIRFTALGGVPNAGPVEFMAIGVTGWTTNCVVFIDRETRTKCDAAPIEIRVRQLVNGVYVVGRTYVFEIRRLCPGPLNCPAPAMNHAPVVAGGIPNQITKVGTPFRFEIPQNAFNDPDGNAMVYVVDPTPPAPGIFTSSGLFFGTPTVAGTYTLGVTAYDNFGGSVMTTFTITVLPADGTVPPGNNPPVVQAGIPDQTGQVGTAFNFPIPANAFRDPDGNTLTYTVSTLPAGLSFNNGIISGTPQLTGVTTVTVTAFDGNGGFVSTTFRITIQSAPVTPGNNPPVVQAGIADQTGRVGTAFSFPIPANAFRDPDGNTLTYTVSTLPAGLSFSNGVITGTPQLTGVTTVTVTASDGNGGFASTTFRITIQPAGSTNPPLICGSGSVDGSPLRATTPVFDCAQITTTGEIRFTGAGGDPNGGPIEFMSVGITGWTTNCQAFVDRETRNKCDAPAVEIRIRQLVNGAYVYGTPFVFDIRKLCPIAGCGTPPSSNRPPVVLNGIPDQTGRVGTAFTYQIPANAFSDPDGNTLAYVVSATPAGISTSSGLFTGTPQVAGTTSITVTAYDGFGGMVSTTFRIIILPANSTDPITPPTPTTTATCGSSSLDGSTLRATVPVFDCSQLTTTGEIRFMGAGGNPNGGSIEFMAAGVTGWTTNCQAFLDREIRTRCDAPAIEIRIRQLVNGIYVYGTPFIFDVRRLCPIAGCATPPSANRPPVVTNAIPDQRGQVGVSFTYRIPANTFFDADGNALVYTASATPAGISFSGDAFSGVPQSAGTTLVTVSAFDGYGGMVSTTFRIIIERIVTTSLPVTPTQSQAARVAAPENVESPIMIRVFGNPTAGETIDFDIEGVAGKTLRLIIVDGNGRPTSQQTVENAAPVEHQTMRLGQTAGLYLLKVSTDGQSKTVKIIKQ